MEIFGCCIKKEIELEKSVLDVPESSAAPDDFEAIPELKESDYEWHETIGTGSYGTVRRVVRNSDKLEMSCKISNDITTFFFDWPYGRI